MTLPQCLAANEACWMGMPCSRCCTLRLPFFVNSHGNHPQAVHRHIKPRPLCCVLTALERGKQRAGWSVGAVYHMMFTTTLVQHITWQ